MGSTAQHQAALLSKVTALDICLFVCANVPRTSLSGTIQNLFRVSSSAAWVPCKLSRRICSFVRDTRGRRCCACALCLLLFFLVRAVGMRLLHPWKYFRDYRLMVPTARVDGLAESKKIDQAFLFFGGWPSQIASSPSGVPRLLRVYKLSSLAPSPPRVLPPAALRPA